MGSTLTDMACGACLSSTQSPPLQQKKLGHSKSRVVSRTNSRVFAPPPPRTIRDDLAEERVACHLAEMEPAFDALFRVAAAGGVADCLEAMAAEARAEAALRDVTPSRASSFRGRSSDVMTAAGADKPRHARLTASITVRDCLKLLHECKVVKVPSTAAPEPVPEPVPEPEPEPEPVPAKGVKGAKGKGGKGGKEEKGGKKGSSKPSTPELAPMVEQPPAEEAARGTEAEAFPAEPTFEAPPEPEVSLPIGAAYAALKAVLLPASSEDGDAFEPPPPVPSTPPAPGPAQEGVDAPKPEASAAEQTVDIWWGAPRALSTPSLPPSPPFTCGSRPLNVG